MAKKELIGLWWMIFYFPMLNGTPFSCMVLKIVTFKSTYLQKKQSQLFLIFVRQNPSPSSCTP